ncbi:hypothetical protein C0993_012035 [Termitomyces sp. T159_Od127]|nr:hypothetical protein C0993_012035 [Termitomyces sp. T159_Od127]
MPRSGQESGYDPMPVCAYCIDFLSITAAGKSLLRTLHLSKLKKYLEAYNIDIGRVVEKDDLIDAILKARSSNGCLSPENEDYYRNYSVPDKSTSHTRTRFFGRSAGQSSNRPPPPAPSVPPRNTRPYNFPRPDLDANTPLQQPRTPRPGPPPPPRQTHPSHRPPPSVPPRSQYQSPPPPSHHHQQRYHQQPHGQHHQYSHNPPPRPTPPQASRPTGHPQNQHPSTARSTEDLHRHGSQQPRQRAASAGPPATSPPPTLEQLLDMPDDSIKTLSIGALKAILFTNHVNVRQILEKGDLIVKVKALIEDERRDRERQRALHEAEEQEAVELQRAMMEEHARAQAERQQRQQREQQAQRQEGSSPAPVEAQGEDTAQNTGTARSPEPSPAPAPPPKSPPKARGTALDLERTGLCVICQDEEANIAIVDCGYVFVLSRLRGRFINVFPVILRCAEDALT